MNNIEATTRILQSALKKQQEKERERYENNGTLITKLWGSFPSHWATGDIVIPKAHVMAIATQMSGLASHGMKQLEWRLQLHPRKTLIYVGAIAFALGFILRSRRRYHKKNHEKSETE